MIHLCVCACVRVRVFACACAYVRAFVLNRGSLFFRHGTGFVTPCTSNWLCHPLAQPSWASPSPSFSTCGGYDTLSTCTPPLQHNFTHTHTCARAQASINARVDCSVTDFIHLSQACTWACGQYMAKISVGDNISHWWYRQTHTTCITQPISAHTTCITQPVRYSTLLNRANKQ